MMVSAETIRIILKKRPLIVYKALKFFQDIATWFLEMPLQGPAYLSGRSREI